MNRYLNTSCTFILRLATDNVGKISSGFIFDFRKDLIFSKEDLKAEEKHIRLSGKVDVIHSSC